MRSSLEVKTLALLNSVALVVSTFRSRHVLLDVLANQQCLMGLELYIHPCVNQPPNYLHHPPPDKPLRIRIQGPLETIQKLVSWHPIGPFPQPGGLKLASLTHQKLYGGEGDKVAPAVRDEYLAWVVEGGIPQE